MEISVCWKVRGGWGAAEGRRWRFADRLRAIAGDHSSWVWGRHGGKAERAEIREIFRRKDQQEARAWVVKGRVPSWHSVEWVVPDAPSSGNRVLEFMCVT